MPVYLPQLITVITPVYNVRLDPMDNRTPTP